MSEFGPIADLPHVTSTLSTTYRQSGIWRGYPLAGWWKRMAAALINYSGPALAAHVVTSPFGGAAGAYLDSLIWLGLTFVMVGVNPRSTDVGKSVLGITTVRPVWTPNGQPGFADVSPDWRIVRVSAHLLDFAFLIGFVLVGFRWNRRSIADSIAGTVVLDLRRNQLDLLPARAIGENLPRDRG